MEQRVAFTAVEEESCNGCDLLLYLQFEKDGPERVHKLFAELLVFAGQVRAQPGRGIHHTLVVDLPQLLHQRHDHKTR